MHISWNFLDKRKGAIKAIEAYDSMDFIMKHTDDEIASVRMKMEGLGSPSLDGMPHAHNPRAGEERLLKGIEEIDTIKERYRQAVEYMNWFKPAWNQLSQDEQFILEAFYMGEEEGSAALTVSTELNIERSSAYNKKNRALDHLTMLLYGKA